MYKALYAQLISKYRVSYRNLDYRPVDVAVVQIGSTYAAQLYRVLRNRPMLSDLELAVICDKGNLPFGFRREGDLIYVYID